MHTIQNSALQNVFRIFWLFWSSGFVLIVHESWQKGMCMNAISCACVAAIAALGNVCQYNKGWKPFCRETT